MRCCVSQTTSIAADAPRNDAQLRAQDVMSAVLFREILKPLASGLGPLGEIEIGAVADSLFMRRVR